jgi:CarboxypepD_reg-like domain/TonB-dependent Receptor Plug Domain
MLLLGIVFSVPAMAQKDTAKLMSANFQAATITQFVDYIERESGFRVYIDSLQFDSVRINLSVFNQTIKQLLDLAFDKTTIYYVFDGEGNIFITRGKMLELLLPKDTASLKIAVRQDQQPVQIAGLENKLYTIGVKSTGLLQNVVTIAGYINDSKTGEPVVGASVFIDQPRIGVITDQYGYYSLSLPRGRHLLNIQSLGMKDARRQIVLNGDGKMNIELQGTVMSLKGVVIAAQKRSNVKNTAMGLQKIDIKSIKQIPVVFGEADVLRAVTTLPGVKTVGEASTGLNVRGGSADQNLILFNEGTIYNPSHFFGMFSAFNPEVIKDVELFKSSIPPRFGGRLSSVLAVNSREGNKKNISGSAGIGLLTSRLNIEGPLIKDKSSFLIGGRTTYSNWLLNLLPDEYKKSKAAFYDLNLTITHEFNKKNTLYLNGYISKDRFNLNSDTLYGYGNKNISAKFKHIFNNKLNAVVAGGYDQYNYGISSEKLPQSANKLGFDINQTYFKLHFNYYLSSAHTLDFGLNTLYYKLHPGKYEPLGDSSLVISEEVPAEQALESALYINDHYNISNALAIDAGVRYAVYNYLGPQNVNTYPKGQPRTTENQLGVIPFAKGDFIKTYQAPEFRASLRYAINDSFSIKAGYNSQQQFIHSLSNTAAMAPTDIWKLSDANIRPQKGDQFSLGAYKNFKSNTIEVSFEVYYKRLKNYLDYKSGAQLVLNPHIETDVIATKGKSYGAELLIKKTSGKLNGWISYTWSRVFLKMDDPLAGELINKGAWYPSNYDKPHDVTIIGNYRFSHRFSVSMNAAYSTGRPITLPVGVYYFGGSFRTLYADRNAYRIPNYFRSDLSMNIEGNHKIHQKTHNSWTIGVYNLTGRKNPYSVYYVSEGGAINGYKLSIFGNPIPYVNFNIRF